MKPMDDFFSGKRYAIFGAKARGRVQGDVLIKALVKAGKSAVAIEADGAEVKGAEVCRSLAEAGAVDGVILLPPSPWDEAAAQFTTEAARQCQAQGMTTLWLYSAGDPAPATQIVQDAGLDPTESRCPCLHIEGGGFPHGLHRAIARFFKQL